MNVSPQELDKKVFDPTKNKEIMLNLCTREGVEALPEMKEVYEVEYPKYAVDPDASKQLGPLMKHKNTTIVMGTWCGDSKYHVPHFYKILDALSVPADQIQIICVDGTKQAENGLIEGLDIQCVPTFIFYEGDKEIGRIIEKPEKTLEKDMIKILVKSK